MRRKIHRKHAVKKNGRPKGKKRRHKGAKKISRSTPVPSLKRRRTVGRNWTKGHRSGIK